MDYRHALLGIAILLAGCADGGPDLFWELAPASEADARAYGPRPDEKFPLKAVDLTQLPPKYRRQLVAYQTSEKPGTIVVDPSARFLYLVVENGRAIRYGVEVGRDGFGWNGTATVARKQAWPTWTPPPEMIARDKRTAPYAKGMPGGPENPLGARALYLYQDGRDTLYRIHGGGRASSIGSATSSGCIRLLDHDVVDLFQRVPTGTKTIVLPPQVTERSNQPSRTET